MGVPPRPEVAEEWMAADKAERRSILRRLAADASVPEPPARAPSSDEPVGADYMAPDSDKVPPAPAAVPPAPGAPYLDWPPGYGWPAFRWNPDAKEFVPQWNLPAPNFTPVPDIKDTESRGVKIQMT